MDRPEINPDLIQDLKKGDPQAFTAFFEMHYRPLCYFATQLTGSSPEAEDIVKDAFVKLWHKHKDFETPQNIKAFLYISTRNACLNYLRHSQVKETSRKELAYLEGNRGEDLIVNQMIRSELMEEVYGEIEKLPEKRREVFKLAYIEGMKNDEIATHLRISIHTVKEHKGKALSFMRMRFAGVQLGAGLLFVLQCLSLMVGH
jgi:RNA polymerase sigma-70 factor (family 1)